MKSKQCIDCGKKIDNRSTRCKSCSRRVPLEIRFWNKVNKNGPVMFGMDTPCWIWIAGKYTNGYGTIQTDIKKICLAHRVSWEIEYKSPIPDGFEVCHHCDNPACVRPSHLFLGTHKDNMHDMIKKNRWFHATKEKHGKHKLTLEQVQEIRLKYKTTHTTYRKLAHEYGVTHQSIYAILNKKNWRE